MTKTLTAALLCLSTSAFAAPKVVTYFSPVVSADQSKPGRLSVVKTSAGHDIHITMPAVPKYGTASAAVLLTAAPGKQSINLEKPFTRKLGYDTVVIHIADKWEKTNGPFTANIGFSGTKPYPTGLNLVSGMKF